MNDSTRRLLVCGSRNWTDEARVFAEIDALRPTSIVHGACPTGVDAIAGRAPARAGSTINGVQAFHAYWQRDGKSAGPRRNARMLAEGKPDRGLAFGALWWLDARQDFSLGVVGARWRKTGTGDMVSRMLGAGLPVRWISAPEATALDLVEMPDPPSR